MKTQTMNTWTTSAALALLLAGGAAAQDTYDLRATYAAQEGDRYRLRRDVEQRMDILIEAAGQVVQDEEGTSITELDYEEEVVALSEGEVVQAQREYHRIKIESEEGAMFVMGDLDLEDVEVLWVLKEGTGQFYEPDGSELSPDMQEKLETLQFAMTRDQFPIDDVTLLTEDPVAVGDEWELPMEAAGQLVQVPGGEANEDMFVERVGRLVEVLEIEGHEVLHVQIEIKTDMTGTPGAMQFNETAGMDCTVDMWVAADSAHPHMLRRVEVIYLGEGKHANIGPQQNQTMSVSMDIRMVLVEERSSVGDDAWAISDAVEVTTMFDEDDTDDAGE